MGRIVPLTRFDRANRHLAADFGLGVAFETHPHTGPRPETWPPASTGCDSFALRTAVKHATRYADANGSFGKPPSKVVVPLSALAGREARRRKTTETSFRPP
jgi:hypothetical protein